MIKILLNLNIDSKCLIQWELYYIDMGYYKAVIVPFDSENQLMTIVTRGRFQDGEIIGWVILSFLLTKNHYLVWWFN